MKCPKLHLNTRIELGNNDFRNLRTQVGSLIPGVLKVERMVMLPRIRKKMPVGVTFWFPVYLTSTRIHVFIPHPFPHASNVLNWKQQNWRGRGKDIRKRFNNFECGCRCLRYQYGRWSVEFDAKRSCDLIWMSGSISIETKMGFKRKKVSTLPWWNKQGQKRKLYWKVFVP